MTVIFNIYKVLLNLQDLTIVEILLSDNFYLSTFGALEYNPEINRSHEISKYREFLQTKATHKSLVFFSQHEEKSIKDKITFIYRVNYLKDTALATGIEENVMVSYN